MRVAILILGTLCLVTITAPVGISQGADECEGEPTELPEADDLTMAAIREAEWVKYQSLRQVFSDEELDRLDEELAQLDTIVPTILDSTDGGDGDVGDEETIEPVIKEVMNSAGEAADLLKEVVEIAKGATPTLHTKIRLHEHSNHKDVWTFYVKVRAYQDCTLLGDEFAEKVFKDKYARTDEYTGFLELQLAKAAPDVSDITHVWVKGDVETCRYGWYSGKEKGCGSGSCNGEVDVEFLD